MALINNIEFDHADIYQDVSQIEAQFSKLASLVTDRQDVIMHRGLNASQGSPQQLVTSHGQLLLGERNERAYLIEPAMVIHGADGPRTSAKFEVKGVGKVNIVTRLLGNHNLANISQILSTFSRLIEHPQFAHLGKKKAQLEDAFTTFNGVKRRLEKIAPRRASIVFEDFAHHPTAVREVLVA